jgi:molybdopterin-guanine dinucleotide biosynthesis protein A
MKSYQHSSKHNSVTVAGVILAGGNSTRFGSDKRVAIRDGISLLGSACQKMKHVVGGQGPLGISIASHDDPDAFRDSVVTPCFSGTNLDAFEFDLINDVQADKGPLCAILSSLSAFETDWVIVLAADLPSVSTETLSRLIERITTDNSDRLLAVLAEGTSGDIQPLIGCYNKRFRTYIEEAISTGNLGVRRLMNSIELLPDAGLIERLWLSEEELRNINFAGDV